MFQNALYIWDKLVFEIENILCKLRAQKAGACVCWQNFWHLQNIIVKNK